MKTLDKLQAIVDVASPPETRDADYAGKVACALIAVARATNEAGCICDMAQDRPGLTEHSAKCRALRDALAALNKAIEGGD